MYTAEFPHSENSVQVKWWYINRRYIYAVKICGRYAISKKSVINYFAKDKAFKNTQKSKWHKEIISKYTNT